MRDHNTLTIAEFNGLWARGDQESCPIDHFSDCNNVQFSQSSFQSRDGIDTYLAFRNIRRMYTYLRQNNHSVLALDTDGNILHSGSPTPFVPILSIVGMTDFAFVAINERAYISPHNGRTGLDGEFIYVYLGNGEPAKKIGGAKPTGTMNAVNSGTAGNIELGIHAIGVVYETSTGFLTAIGPDIIPTISAPGGEAANITNIPVSPSSDVIARWLVATKAIDPIDYNGDPTNYQFFFIPNGRIANNVSTGLQVSFFDSELLEDASHLFDVMSEVPAGVNLTTFNNRLVSVAEFGEGDETGNISLARLSNPGEPEAFNAIDGLIVTPLDGNPLTNAQEYRGLLYLFKDTRTYSYTDNEDVPSSWPLTIIDQGLGASIHGIATVLDSGGINIEFLIIINWSGMYLFQGAYVKPEISWKIKDFWLAIDRSNIKNLQVLNDTINQRIYMTLPNKKMLLADYANGLDPKHVRFSPWEFRIQTTTITLINTDTLLIGSDEAFEG